MDLNVSAKEVSGGGGTLSADNMHIYVNGEEVEYRGRSGTAYEYLLHLQQGENEVVISVKDNQQYETTKTYTVLYNPSQITVTFQLEAGTVGLGMLIPRHEVTIDGNTTLAQLVEQQLAEYNFTSMITGSVDNSYYLAGIKKPGMTNGLHVPDELKQMIIEDGMSEQEWQAEIFLMETKSVSVTPWQAERISVSMEMKVYTEMFRVIMAKNGKRNRKIKNREKRGRNR